MTANPDQVLRQALDLHAQGRFAEAEPLYLQCLMELPDNGDVLGMLGMLRLQTGRLREALPHLEKAVRQRPRQANYHMALGEIWRLLAQPGEALVCYQAAAALLPDHADLANSTGIVLRDLGRLTEAAACLERAVALDPAFREARLNLGKVYLELGRHDAALASFQQASGGLPAHAEHLGLQGKALAGLGRADEAADHFRRALALEPEQAEVHCALGNLLLDQQRYQEALDHYHAARRHKPGAAEVLCNIGLAQKRLGRPEEAEFQYRQALASDPSHFLSLNNYGALLQEQGRLAEARACFEKAAQARPDDPLSHYSLGNLCLEEGRLADARAHLDAALARQPDYPEARFCLGLVDFMEGDLAGGWAGYEYRWQGSNIDCERADLDLPQWRGEDPPPGSGLLLYSEQGFGDSLQFARYLPLVARRFGRVVFHTHAPLLSLFESIRPDNCEMRAIDSPYDTTGCNCQAPLMSLPHALNTTLATIPNQVPYLAAAAGRVEHWRRRLAGTDAGHPRIGLVWAGRPTLKSDRKRSLPLALFQPLLARRDVRWISLQKGDAAAQRASLPEPDSLLDLMGEVGDFADTAALLMNLDLILCVDTAVAHLAGALARPVWLLNRHESEWRWMRGREDSPWYPSMRLFNQPAADDWPALLRQVNQALDAELARIAIRRETPRQ